MTTTNIYSNLPEVVEILSLDDAGEGGAATCPHCGAIGRYIYWFQASDGEMHGAMKGCFKHFPKSKYLARMTELMDKERQFKAKGWKLARWDSDVLAAIRDYAQGQIMQEKLDNIISNADRAKKTYMARKGYR
jgi:hypothetical protein